MQPCPGPGSVQQLGIYVFHPEDHYDIAGQDVADLLVSRTGQLQASE